MHHSHFVTTRKRLTAFGGSANRRIRQVSVFSMINRQILSLLRSLRFISRRFTIRVHNFVIGQDLRYLDISNCRWLRGVLEGLPIIRVIDWSIDWLIGWLIDCSIDWLVGRWLNRLIDWLIDWSDDIWLIDFWTFRLIVGLCWCFFSSEFLPVLVYHIVIVKSLVFVAVFSGSTVGTQCGVTSGPVHLHAVDRGSTTR